MPRYKVAFTEVRHPDTGVRVPKGKFIETETERGTRQADVLVKVGRLEAAPRPEPVRRVETRAMEAAEGAPEVAAEPEASEAKPARRTYNTRRLKAED